MTTFPQCPICKTQMKHHQFCHACNDITVGDTTFIPSASAVRPTELATDSRLLATALKPLKLDLACGQTPREGFEGVDLYANAMHKVNLLQFPWKWADDSVDEIFCSHFIEHIPDCYTDENNREHLIQRDGSVDLFLRFFDEVYRILKPGGVVTVIVPYLQNQRAFQDPTHRRFICESTFFYLNAEWRALNKLDHYLAKCHLVGRMDPAIHVDYAAFSAEALAPKMKTGWNVVTDLQAVLQKIVRPETKAT